MWLRHTNGDTRPETTMNATVAMAAALFFCLTAIAVEAKPHSLKDEYELSDPSKTTASNPASNVLTDGFGRTNTFTYTDDDDLYDLIADPVVSETINDLAFINPDSWSPSPDNDTSAKSSAPASNATIDTLKRSEKGKKKKEKQSEEKSGMKESESKPKNKKKGRETADNADDCHYYHSGTRCPCTLLHANSSLF